jgi:Acetyltransferase (GNAT) domain
VQSAQKQSSMNLGQDHNESRITQATPAVSQYNVRTIQESEWPVWDAFVHESPQGTLFHTTKWLTSTGAPFRIYGCYQEDALIGGMAVELVGPKAAGHSFFTTSTGELEVNGNSVGNVLCHGASCPYLGVVLPPPSKKYLTTLAQHRRILNSLALHIKDQFASIHSRMVPEVIDMQPFIWAGYSISLRYTFRIDLSDLAIAWGDMTDKRRNDIRKAERDGIIVDDQGSMQDILALVMGTFQRQGRAARFSELAERRDQMLRDNNQCRCFIARNRSGEAVGGIYMVWDNKCAYYLMGGYGVASAHRGAGALAIWEAIRFASSTLGLQQFDILAAGSPSIERFIRDFAGRLTVAFMVDYSRPSFSRDVQRVMRRVKSLIIR